MIGICWLGAILGLLIGIYIYVCVCGIPSRIGDLVNLVMKPVSKWDDWDDSPKCWMVK